MRKREKNIQRIVTSGPACKVFIEKKAKNTENSEKTERHTQQDYDVRAF